MEEGMATKNSTTSENSEEVDDTQNDSSKGSNTDEASSIEALNWSDLEDEDEVGSDLLRSINSQVSSEKLSSVEDESNKMSDSVISNGTTITEVDDLKQRQGTKRKREESPIMAVSTHSTTSTEVTGDLSSNAAVLDDGPIWAKGSKRYKFEENRRVNQKLTFGVLLSVVLAVGLGLGNLVAYNECEAEHKSVEPACPLKASAPPPPLSSTMSENIPSVTCTRSTEKIPEAPFTEKILPTESFRMPGPSPLTPDLVAPTIAAAENFQENPLDPAASYTARGMDSKHRQQAEQLSRILSMLDELSHKIDHFENTTKQFSGIVMMQDEFRESRKTSLPKKTNFTETLSKLLELKKPENPTIPRKRSWKLKRQEILEELAGAVLDAMREIKEYPDLEETETLDDLEDDVAAFEHIENVKTHPPRHVENPENLNQDNLQELTPELTLSEQSAAHFDLSTEMDVEGIEIPSDTINTSPRHAKGKAKILEKQEGNVSDDKKVREEKNGKTIHEKQENQGKRMETKNSERCHEDGDTSGNRHYRKSSKLEDWEARRAHEREASRIHGQISKRDSKYGKHKNWQLERDRIREQSRQAGAHTSQ